jgi:hypothetical protein
MALGEHNNDITRQYLLGQLTDDEEQSVEERLLSDDELYQELELAKDELTQEYVNGQLTAKENEWLQNNLLRSPEGKQKQQFAHTFARYARNHRKQPKPSGFTEWLRSLFRAQPVLVAATSFAVLVIAVAVIYQIRTPSPQSFATLTLVNKAGTRSADPGSIPSVRLKEDALKLILTLPQPASPAAAYRVELLDDKGGARTFDAQGQDGRSVVVEIPAANLPRGQYAVIVSTLDDRGGVNRIPGSYYFTIE